ncbi:protease inhibitor I42 family protein [Pseudomonas sp. 5P_3.1_Bac2]|uniref:protease inhibitor I42 family protein n=1 Tax=Pseudomonas sp. 5P_3.1_Bac2 TaxID=2971617 RepID=UPI0021C5BC77|nr:protease inhibitor I42 family protein [Pseudomonas sp. 5P_3.1_Bac2]MCU1715939.1 protease inhibitor I42 family protein [Pseudomonas sp. 5P_3.1_Bac2]
MSTQRLLLSMALLPLLGACAHQASNDSTVQLEQESRCPQELQVGQQLILSLPSNPSTGFRWQLHSDATPVLRSLGPEVYSATDSGEIVGSGGLSTWRFQVERAGSATLSLLYQQPWATNEEPAERFSCQLNAH